jgi:hypothetical protein
MTQLNEACMTYRQAAEQAQHERPAARALVSRAVQAVEVHSEELQRIVTLDEQLQDANKRAEEAKV